MKYKKILKKLNKIFATVFIAYALLNSSSKYVCISKEWKEIISAMKQDYRWYGHNEESSYFIRKLDDDTPQNNVLEEYRYIIDKDLRVICKQRIHRLYW